MNKNQGSDPLLRKLLQKDLAIVLISSFFISASLIAASLFFLDPNIIPQRIVQSSLVAVFSAFMTSSIILFIVEYGIKNTSNSIFSLGIKKIVRSEFSKHLQIEGSGIIGVHERFTIEQTKSLLEISTNVYILQTYSPTLDQLARNYIKFVKDGGKIKLLILSPKSPYITIRCAEMDKTPDAYISGVEHNLKIIEEIRQKSVRDAVKVGIYDDSPGICIHGNSNKMYAGSFLKNQHGVDSNHLEIRQGSLLFNNYIDHYDALWQSSIKL